MADDVRVERHERHPEHGVAPVKDRGVREPRPDQRGDEVEARGPEEAQHASATASLGPLDQLLALAVLAVLVGIVWAAATDARAPAPSAGPERGAWFWYLMLGG
jgi:hypothetical protein